MFSTMPLQWHTKLFILALGAIQLSGSGTVKPAPAPQNHAEQHGDDPWSQTYRPGTAPPAQTQQPQQTPPVQTQQPHPATPTLQLRGQHGTAEDTDPEPAADKEAEQTQAEDAGEQTTTSGNATALAAATQPQPTAGAEASEQATAAAAAATSSPTTQPAGPATVQPHPGGATQQPVPTNTGRPPPTPAEQRVTGNLGAAGTQPPPHHPPTGPAAMQHPVPVQSTTVQVPGGTPPTTAAPPQQWGQPQQATRPKGWMPGRTPKDAWGYYAPPYDPDTDPWHEDEDGSQSRADQPPAQQSQSFTRQGAQQHVPSGLTGTTAPATSCYSFPYDPWEDELDQPTPTQAAPQQLGVTAHPPATCQPTLPQPVTYMKPTDGGIHSHTTHPLLPWHQGDATSSHSMPGRPTPRQGDNSRAATDGGPPPTPETNAASTTGPPPR